MSAELPTVKNPRRRYWLDAVIAVCLAVGLAAALLWQTVFVMIPAGSVGVIYRLFGDGSDTTTYLPEGLAYKLPWNIVYLYEARTQTKSFTAHTLAKDGLAIDVELDVLYHPDLSRIGFLNREIGPEYYQRKIRPNVTEATRQIVGQYDPHDLYKFRTQERSREILVRARTEMDYPSIVLVDVIIRKIALPDELNDAITRKLTQEQIVQTYEYRLQTARHEAERKRIEAIGIQTFYSIVSDALTPALLTWRGIEATVDIANSPNSKIVIVGGGEDQMPLILGSDISNVPASPPTVAVRPENVPEIPKMSDIPPLFPNDRILKDDFPDESPSAPTGQPSTTLPTQ